MEKIVDIVEVLEKRRNDGDSRYGGDGVDGMKANLHEKSAKTRRNQ